MRILMSPVAQKQMATDDITSLEMLLDIVSAHEKDSANIVLCLQKYSEVHFEIPVTFPSFLMLILGN